MRHFIQNLLPSRHKKVAGMAPRFTEADLAAIPRYPPFREGLPAAPVDAVLQTQNELLGRIRLLLGMADDQYEDIVVPVVSRYAEFVHLLPASEAHHHRGAGGLLRHGLEVGFWSAQFSIGQIFPFDGPPRNKRAHEQRWLFAAFIAGLAHDLGKPLSDMEITTAQGDSVWSPYMESLAQWSKNTGVDRYFVRWRSSRVHKRHEEFTLTILKDIAGRPAMQFMSEYDPELLPALFRAVGGTTASGSLARLVMRADQESVKRDLQNVRLDPNEASYGEPAEKYLFDAMRTLVSSGAWTVNKAGSAVWILEEGVFVAWQNSMGTLRAALEKLGAKGIPTDPGKIADLLIERGYAIGRETITEDGEVLNYRYWPIKAPVSTDEMSGKVTVLALRLESAKLVFPGEVPAAKEGAYIDEKDQTAKGEKQPANKSDAQIQGSPQMPGGTATTLVDEASATASEAKRLPSNTLPGSALSLDQSQELVNRPTAPVQSTGSPATTMTGEGTTADQGQDRETETADPNLPPDFPDMVQALMATEPVAPPLKLAPEQLQELSQDAGSADGQSKNQAQAATDEVPAYLNDVPDDLYDGLPPGPRPNSDASKSTTKGNRVRKNKEPGQARQRPPNADILGLGAKQGSDSLDFDLLGNLPGLVAAQLPSALEEQPAMPGLDLKSNQALAPTQPKWQAKQKKNKKGRDTQGATNPGSAETQHLEQAFAPYGDAGSIVLAMLDEIRIGNSRLGESIDRREGLYCVRTSAFESEEAFQSWYKSALESQLVEAFEEGLASQWECNAVALRAGLQPAVNRAVQDIERSLDPFAVPVEAAQHADNHGRKSMDAPKHQHQAIERKGTPQQEANNKGDRNRLGQPHKVRNEEAEADAEFTQREPALPKGAFEASSVDEPQESVAQAIQTMIESVELRPKVSTRTALDQLAEMLVAGHGEWLADPRADGDVMTIDMSRSLDLIVAHAQCSFSKAALRVALNSHRRLARRNGRIWLKA